MSEAALRFEGVTRRFRDKTAVDALDLTVEPGSVLGFVGRNGAGKTTSLRLAQGMLYPDAGRIRVLGLDPTVQGRQVRMRVSLLAEETHLYPWMTVRQILDFGAALHPSWDADLARSLTRRLELDAGQLVRNVSRGTRAKIALVLAVAPRPDLLLLDDPTAGLDPLVRREVLQGVLESIPQEGGAVVYASHLIHDVERVADRVAVIDHGRMRLEGSLDELKQRVRRVTGVFDDGAPAEADVPGKIDWVAEGRLASLVAEGTDQELSASVRRLGAREVRTETLTLEEILVACLRQGRTEGAGHV